MTDPDDEALRWEGDDRQAVPARAADAPAARREPRPDGGALALLVIGVLGGVAVLEAAFTLRGVLLPTIAASVVPSGTGPLPAAAAVINVAGRVLAVAAPLVWFAAVLRVVRTPSRRLAWLVLGAVLLLPWPALLAAT